MPHPTLSSAHPCGSLVLQPASQHRSVPQRDSSESVENLLISFAPVDSQSLLLSLSGSLCHPKLEHGARLRVSQGFYQISLPVALRSHNSSRSQGPAVIVLAWAGVTWRWGRAERLASPCVPVCIYVCVYVCVCVCVCMCVGGMDCRESPVWSSVGCQPQPMLGMVSKCWPAHQTLCNLLTLCWDREQAILCPWSLGVESPFPTVLQCSRS